MKFFVIPTLAAALAIGCSRQEPSGPKGAVPAKDGPTDARQDQKGLAGTWKVVTIGGNGKAMPPEGIGDMKVTISGQQYTASKSGRIIEQATMTTDPSRQPKTIDLTFTQGEAKGQTLLGIYEVTGDTWRLALSEPGKVRPTEIANRAGLRQDVWELRRD
jgi:uncharacterized protein (TIGR03067 family)